MYLKNVIMLSHGGSWHPFKVKHIFSTAICQDKLFNQMCVKYGILKIRLKHCSKQSNSSAIICRVFSLFFSNLFCEYWTLANEKHTKKNFMGFIHHNNFMMVIHVFICCRAVCFSCIRMKNTVLLLYETSQFWFCSFSMAFVTCIESFYDSTLWIHINTFKILRVHFLCRYISLLKFRASQMKCQILTYKVQQQWGKKKNAYGLLSS